MAPLIKYFIIVFIVFYLCSYNGCLAEIEMCESQINELFKQCDLCKSQNVKIRVQNYLEFILSNIIVTDIQTLRYASPFVMNILLMLTMTEADKPESPEKFCSEMYTENKVLCDRGMKKFYGPEYEHGQICMQKTFLFLSIAHINTEYKKYAAPLIAYMNYVKSYTGFDPSTFSSGTTPESYCWIELVENDPVEMSSNQPQESGTQRAIFNQPIGPSHIIPNNREEGSGQNWVDKKRSDDQSSAGKKRPESGGESSDSKKIKPAEEATKAQESQKVSDLI